MSASKTNHVKLHSRLAVARWAIDNLPDRVKVEGTYQAATPSCPAFWSLTERGCRFLLAPNVLRLPDDPALSMLLDVSLEMGGKVLSVSWFPDLPWIPPHLSSLKPGDWMYRLGWKGE